jgi:glycosyltransferase involved in cell wall biosynthesis
MKVSIIIFNVTLSAGTERAVVNLANIINDEAQEVSIISCSSYVNNSSFFDINPHIRVYDLGISEFSGVKKITNYIRLIERVRNLLRVLRPDFILGTAHALNCLLPLINIGMPSKTIACEHTSYNATPFISKLIKRYAYRLVNQVVVLTNHDLEKYDFLSNIRVIQNSVPFSVDKPASLKKKQILAIGRLSYEKGFDLLIEAAPFYFKECPHWTIKIIGSGALKEKLQHKVIELGLRDKIVFANPIKDIVQEYLESSIYVMSSRYEGFPMVLIEAKACGLPCISFNCPEGPAEIIANNEDGFLVNSFDIFELSNKMVLLSKNEDLRKEMGRKALVNSERFSMINIKKKWWSLFHELNK